MWRSLGLLSILLYLIALAVPALDIKLFEEPDSSTLRGVSGWFCLIRGIQVPYWITNPLLFGAWFALFRGSKLSAYWAIGSAIFAGMFTYWWLNDSPADSFKVGYWLWMASILVSVVAGFILLFTKKPVPPK